MLISFQSNAQDSTKQTFKSIIDAKHYVFTPTSMTAKRGTKQLNYSYLFQISGDTLKVYLPYAGRAYSAPIGSSDDTFDFTTTDFTYNVKAGKKKSYVISVQTKNQRSNTSFTLTVYDNGAAYLNANNNDRDPVSYNGNVDVIKTKK